MLDRPAAESDALDAHFLQRLASQIDVGSVRLALAVEGLRVYVGVGTQPETLFLALDTKSGGGSSIGPRETLVTHGATRQEHSGIRGSVTAGIVPDIVTAVRVGGLYAELGNNVYVARAPVYEEIVLTTIGGRERTMPPVPRPDPRRATPNRLPGPTRSLGT